MFWSEYFSPENIQTKNQVNWIRIDTKERLVLGCMVFVEYGGDEMVGGSVTVSNYHITDIVIVYIMEYE